MVAQRFGDIVAQEGFQLLAAPCGLDELDGGLEAGPHASGGRAALEQPERVGREPSLFEYELLRTGASDGSLELGPADVVGDAAQAELCRRRIEHDEAEHGASARAVDIFLRQ